MEGVESVEEWGEVREEETVSRADDDDDLSTAGQVCLRAVSVDDCAEGTCSIERC